MQKVLKASEPADASPDRLHKPTGIAFDAALGGGRSLSRGYQLPGERLVGGCQGGGKRRQCGPRGRGRCIIGY